MITDDHQELEVKLYLADLEAKGTAMKLITEHETSEGNVKKTVTWYAKESDE